MPQVLAILAIAQAALPLVVKAVELIERSQTKPEGEVLVTQDEIDALRRQTDEAYSKLMKLLNEAEAEGGES